MKATKISVISSEKNYLLTVSSCRRVFFRRFVSGNITLCLCTNARGIFVTAQKGGVQKAEYYRLRQCNVIVTRFSVASTAELFTLVDSVYGLPISRATLTFWGGG